MGWFVLKLDQSICGPQLQVDLQSHQNMNYIYSIYKYIYISNRSPSYQTNLPTVLGPFLLQDLVWAPCRLQTVDDGTASLVFDGEMVQRPEGAVQDLSQVQDGHLDGVDDICSLSIVTEAALLHTVRVRSFRCKLGHGFVWKCWELPKIWFRKSVYLWEVAILGYTLFFDTPDAFAVHFFKNTGLQYGLCCFCVHGLNRFKAPFGQA